MQRITDRPFLKVLARYGGPDQYVTEYFRVHEHSKLDPYILTSIDDNPTDKPISAQLIGQDLPSLARTAKELLHHPILGIDLNLGCPAPVVCRKNAGGGLLRNLSHIDRILGTLREQIPTPYLLTVKTRLGYDTIAEFPALLDLFAKHHIDALAIHGRTVRERYQSPVHPFPIQLATQILPCPIYANGNVVDLDTGRALLARTGAHGLMIGRGAIRNPWLFSQLRAQHQNRPPFLPCRHDLLLYITALWEETIATYHSHPSQSYEQTKHVQKMKKYLNYISQGIEPEFEASIRRTRTKSEFFSICQHHLNSDTPLIARPPERSKLFCGFSDLLSPL